MRRGTGQLARTLPDDQKSLINVEGSLSATGPGLMLSTSKVPRLKAKADFGGTGVAASFTSKELASIVAFTGAKNLARQIRKQAPKQMYMGLEVSPLPVSAGVVVNKTNVQDTSDKLRALEASLETKRQAAGREARS